MDLEAAFLATAMSNEKVSKLQFLVDDGVDVNCRHPTTGRTALMNAVDLGLTKVLDTLISMGASVNVPDNRGLTPLQLACSQGSLETAKKLLEKGANINAADNFGFTALHSATFFGRLSCVEYLMSKGANPTLVASGKTALALADESGNFLIASALRKPSESSTTKSNNTPSSSSSSSSSAASRVVEIEDDLPPLEGPEGKLITPSPSSSSSSSSSSTKKTLSPAQEKTKPAITIPAGDTEWSPTDTYGSLKSKLALANQIIAQLRGNA